MNINKRTNATKLSEIRVLFTKQSSKSEERKTRIIHEVNRAELKNKYFNLCVSCSGLSWGSDTRHRKPDVRQVEKATKKKAKTQQKCSRSFVLCLFWQEGKFIS